MSEGVEMSERSRDDHRAQRARRRALRRPEPSDAGGAFRGASTIALSFSASALLGCGQGTVDLAGLERGMAIAAGLFALIAFAVIATAVAVIHAAFRGRRPPLLVGLVVSGLALVVEAPRAIELVLDGRAGESPIAIGALVPLATFVTSAVALLLQAGRGRGARNADEAAARRARWAPVVAGPGAAALVGAAVLVAARVTSNPSTSAVPDAADLAIGRAHACFLTRAGAVWCGGDNASGATGARLRSKRSGFSPVRGITGARAVVVGDGFSCALVAAGPTCWGTLDGLVDEPSTTERRGEVVHAPTLIADAPGAVEIYALRDTLAWRMPDGRIFVRRARDGETTTLTVSPDAAEVVIDGSRICSRTASGHLECRGDNAFAPSETLRLEGARRVALGTFGFKLCVERENDIACYGDFRGADLRAIDATHLATTREFHGVACGARGTKVVCAALETGFPPGEAPVTTRELDVGASIDGLHGGPGGFCARLAGGAYACFSAFGCFDRWMRDGGCTPKVRPSPLRATDEEEE